MGLLSVFLAGSAFAIARQPNFHRQWKLDELVTLQNYTWAGINDDGTRRDLGRNSAIEGLGAASPRRLLMGVYCSLGRWAEPNNHAIYSLLASAPLAFLKDKLVAFRLPALAIGGAFALSVAVVCWRCGWRKTAFAAGIVAFWNPYVVRYAQEGRGYTLMLLLATLFLIASERVLRNPRAVVPASVLVALSILLFQNTVNMAVDWVAPCYLAMMAFPGIFGDSNAPDQHGPRRKSLLIQMLCVGIVGFVYLMDRLPYVYSSALQYGVPMESLGEFPGLLANHLGYLFPTLIWRGFLVLGIVGVGIALSERVGRGYSTLGVAAVLASLAHFAVTKRFAYERNVGFWMVPLLLGYGCLGQRLYNAFQWPRGVAAAVVYGMSLVLAASAFQTPVPDDRDPIFDAFRARFPQLREEGAGPPTLALHGTELAEVIRLEYPPNWSEARVANEEGAALDLILVEKQRSVLGLSEAAGPMAKTISLEWPGAEILLQEGSFSVTRLPCRVSVNQPSQPPGKLVALWYPSLESVSLTPSRVIEYLDQNQTSHYPVQVRYQVKMDVFSRIGLLVASAWTPEEAKRLREVFEEGRRRFGGEVIMLVPRE